MEVVCGRCKADYEFDDALISARGTVVRCTNCGLQFKVFPPGGVGAPEEWSVLSEDGQEILATYATLADLQRAIGLGEVNGDDLLVRGDESPRRLGEILELAPLLRQGASYRPPNASERPPAATPFAKTRIGLPGLADLGVDETQNTPSPAPVPADMRPRRPQDGPRIRSALSGPFLGVKVAPEPSPGTLPTGSPPFPSSRAHLPSLTATLASPVPPPLPAADGREEVRTPRPAPEPSSQSASGPPSPRKLASSSDPLGTTQPSVSPGPRSDPPPPSSARGRPTAPRRLESAGASSVDAIALARAERQPRRMARGALFVIAIGVGAVIFAATLGRERLSRLTSSPPNSNPGTELGVEPEVIPAEPRPESGPTDEQKSGEPAALSALSREINSLEVEFWRDQLESVTPSPPKPGLTEKAEKLLTTLEAVTRGRPNDDELVSVLRVNLLRMLGRSREARARLGELGEAAAGHPYAVAMLDLFDNSTGISRSAQISELSRARRGDAPFLPETAVIYALGRDRQMEQAKLELSHLRGVAGPNTAPLDAELEKFLEALEAPSGTPSERAKPASEKVQAWAREADSLWSGGDQKAAVVLYQKVKKALGTNHFLGQRAAARIQQASREGVSR
jgi:predicted Zn finger-like uncharacterized protein